jgi:glycosyltransferase involved in cell wall biosynthesis
MRILLTNFHETDGGGHTSYVLSLARGLATRHAVTVAAPPGSRLHREAAQVAGIEVLAQPFPHALDEWFARRHALRQLSAWFDAHPVDVVQVAGSADHRLVLAALRGRRPRPLVVLARHNSKPLRGLGHWWRARATDLVIAVSAWSRDELATTPYRRCRIACVPNGVDTARFSPASSAEAIVARRRWFPDDVPQGEPGAPLVLGSVAGTAAFKGWMDLVEALALLAPEERAACRVLLCGRDPSARDQARIDALGLRDQVRCAGLLDDVRPAIAACDAGFVLSYAVETISIACREMMAMGKPVLATRYAGLPENIEADVDGWIVPPRDPAAIAAAIRAMLADRARLVAMGQAARAHALAEFGIERCVAATEAAYADVLRAQSS